MTDPQLLLDLLHTAFVFTSYLAINARLLLYTARFTVIYDPHKILDIYLYVGIHIMQCCIY